MGKIISRVKIERNIAMELVRVTIWVGVIKTW
jgi:hypothetical protein